MKKPEIDGNKTLVQKLLYRGEVLGGFLIQWSIDQAFLKGGAAWAPFLFGTIKVGRGAVQKTALHKTPLTLVNLSLVY